MTAIQPIKFDLHKLGWKAFEDLVACIFRDILGQTFQSFAEGTDGGRDGAFHGMWSPSSKEALTGRFTIQCKHTSNDSKLLQDAVIQDEFPKVRKLAAQGLCDIFILVTNYKVTAKRAHKTESAFKTAGAKSAKVYGSDWINAIIAEKPTLRRLVPRLYGLGDLTQIVTNQAYRQSIAMLDSIAPDLNCFVPTEAYRRSAHSLKEHGFVLLIGEPASGKTMIANLLALSAADEWGLQTIMLSSPEEFSKFWNPDDPGQFLWVDDAFGSNQYDPNRVNEWNHRLPKLKTAIHKGARVVFTSRDYIFNSAKSDLKISSFELFEDSRVLIEVEKLSVIEREMILYNHLKCGNQKVEFKKKVKPFLLDAAKTQKFLPEIARRFGSPKFTKRLQLQKTPIIDFFEKPAEWLEELLNSLSKTDKAAIALVFIAGGNLATPVSDDELNNTTLSSLCSNIGEVKASLPKLEGTFIRFDRGNQTWCFRHPTIRDAFATIVGSNPELIDIYLKGVRTEQLIQEVTCGDLNLEGVKIIIPNKYYGIVLGKLKKYSQEVAWTWVNPVEAFLAYKCSGEFLRRYYTEVDDVTFLPQKISSLGTYDRSLRILRRLYSDGLLSESNRIETVKNIHKLSIIHHSSDFLNERNVGGLLTTEDRQSLWNDLKDYVLSNKDIIIEEKTSSWDIESDPDDEFSDLRTTLEEIAYRGSDQEANIAEKFIDEIKDVIHVMEEKQQAMHDYNPLVAEDTKVESEATIRSIFDDVDE